MGNQRGTGVDSESSGTSINKKEDYHNNLPIDEQGSFIIASDSPTGLSHDFKHLKGIFDYLLTGQKLHTKRMDELKGAQQNFSQQIKGLKKSASQEKENLQEEIKRLQRQKIELIAIGGLFVSIFTFMSIEIQILQYICDAAMLVGLTFAIFAIMSAFAILTHYFTQKVIGVKTKLPVGPCLVFCVAPLIMAILSWGYIPERYHQENCMTSRKVIDNKILNIEQKVRLLETTYPLNRDINGIPFAN
jgi:hypothetical protein